MFYIQQSACISPQQTFADIDINKLHLPLHNQLQVVEPSYEGIPTGILRRMGKAVRLGVGTALHILKNHTAAVDGIILGTANGGMEDCIKFLNQIIDYNEGMLTPTNFVQSTSNAIAAQIGLLSQNKGYNATHVHRGLAFENALLDAGMLLAEHTSSHYLVGGVDEISAYNYNIDYLGGWYKNEPVDGQALYTLNTTGSIAGEGAAMFLLNADKTNAAAGVCTVQALHTSDEHLVAGQLKKLLDDFLPAGEKIDLLLSGEDGDSRLLKYYMACERVTGKQTAVARFKHMMGEYATASATALWLACYILKEQNLPEHMVKHDPGAGNYKKILLYNTHKGVQHSFILLERTTA